MIGTLTALILGGSIWYWSIALPPMMVLVLGVVVGTLLMLSLAPVNILAWGPLQAAEEDVTPRVVELFSNDIQIRAANAVLLIWGLFSWIMPFFDHVWVFIAWLVGLGVVLDLHIHACRRVLKYLNPFTVLQMMTGEGVKEVKAKQDVELSQWIGSISEISQRAMENDSPALSTAGLSATQRMLQEYLQFNRARLVTADAASDSHQRASYILYYAFERMETLFHQGLDAHNEPVCSNVITTLGKVTLDCAAVNFALVPYPVSFIGAFAKMAAREGMGAVSTKARFLLVQISKLMLAERDVTGMDLKKALLAVTRQLEEITKESFKADKSVRISELTQPFLELKMILQSERLLVHPDTEVIVSDIDRVLGDFASLELLMKAIPPIPETAKAE